MAFNVMEALKKQEVKSEDVIGEMGGKAPRLCAASGRPLVQPWITYHLDNGRYFRVMARFQNQLGADVRKQLNTFGESTARPTKSSKPEGEVKS